MPEPPVPETKFTDPLRTLAGAPRAVVPLTALRTLWFNTGTLCNITCAGCYIARSPRNDRLAYLTRDDVQTFLDEARTCPDLREIGFTGGEPFMNPDLPAILADTLAAGYRVLVLTNAMRPMQRHGEALLDLHASHPGRLTLRVSLDHYTKPRHEAVRGPKSWAPAIAGLAWLAAHGFDIAVAGRTLWDEPETDLRRGYGGLFEALGLQIDAANPARLVLFPEINPSRSVPEISEACWAILHKQPDDVMCATSRMVVRRRAAERATVLSCTLLAYDPRFEVGATLAEADRPVALNHRTCAEFCVLGGATCSPGA